MTHWLGDTLTTCHNLSKVIYKNVIFCYIITVTEIMKRFVFLKFFFAYCAAGWKLGIATILSQKLVFLLLSKFFKIVFDMHTSGV